MVCASEVNRSGGMSGQRLEREVGISGSHRNGLLLIPSVPRHGNGWIASWKSHAYQGCFDVAFIRRQMEMTSFRGNRNQN
jgi:hypothetical protein